MELALIACAAAATGAGFIALKLHAARKRRLLVGALAKAGAIRHAARALETFAANEYFSAWLLRQFERQFASALDAPLTTNELALLAASERRAYDDDYKMLHGRESFRASYNQRFVDQRVSELMASHPGGQQNAMTAGQWRAIVTEEDSTLVVAAAGSGKTTTILAKIEYLVARGFARPGEICVLAYNKDAANTVREGLEARNIHGVTASTFHALGYAITGEALGFKPPVSPLEANGEIDFDSMLADSISCLDRTRSFRYRYVFVDEFQDTSRSRLTLARSLRDAVDGARLFLVGDDWQSINRFAGSDVGIFVDAEKHVGVTARVDLDVTFRLPEDVLRVSSTFITRNPRQLTKTLSPFRDATTTRNLRLVPFPTNKFQESLEAVLRRIADDDANGRRVLLLARYNREIDQPAVRRIIARYAKTGLAMDVRTIHRAKGLEADHVIVIGLSSVAPGFPSMVLDDPVLQLVSSVPEDFPFAEERRLMYVALTRSLGGTYLLFPEETPSPFIEELREHESANIEILGETPRRFPCPACGGNTVLRRDGKHGAFWACSNFPLCDGRLLTCPHCAEGALLARHARSIFECSDCGKETERCPRCDKGMLVQRQGPRASFWGCSSWRADGGGCTYTRNSTASESAGTQAR
ncbi:MAG: UvrD-helicase domain-containing protein [Proteobacteria bacterium]|nr:UvrD-helicase domain-containing protein [Pseudomonadota bacterium]